MAALSTSRFRPLFDQVEKVVEKAFILPLRHRATSIKVDLAIGTSGFEQQTIARATAIEIANLQVAVATAEDILLMKIFAGRPQDDQDVRGIITAQAEHLDWDYCLKTAGELGEAVGQDLSARVRELRAASRKS